MKYVSDRPTPGAKWLLIQNEGVSPVECFTVLGLSSSRGDEDKIGQFGTGVKQALLLCLRADITPMFFIGTEKLEFYTRDAVLENGLKYRKVFYSWRGDEKELSYCLEHGAIDWRNLDMALREYISNAIDNAPYQVGAYDFSPCGLAGHTRVFIPYNDHVREYHANITTHFLHFKELEKSKFLAKSDKSPPRIYRKGVLIRQLQPNKSLGFDESLFDYNFGDELPIDECRNMDDATCLVHIAKTISVNDLALTAVFTAIRDEKKVYELQCSYSSLTGTRKWKEMWEKIAGKTLISSDARLNSLAEKRNIPVVTLPQGATGFYLEMEGKGIETIRMLIGSNDLKDVTFVKLRRDTENKVIKIHQKCRELGRNANKECPKIISFVKNTNNNECLRGYFDPKLKAVCINIDNATCTSTILEELAHYYTGADDFTRDLQNFAFNLAAALLENDE